MIYILDENTSLMEVIHLLFAIKRGNVLITLTRFYPTPQLLQHFHFMDLKFVN